MREESDVGRIETENEFGFHLCTQADKAHFFHDFDQYSSKGVEDIWEQLYCLDDPTLLEFQLSEDCFSSGSTFHLEITGCQQDDP